MTKQEIHNRGYNLMITALVLLPGLAFGSVILNEAELNDKIAPSGTSLTTGFDRSYDE
jgi:hypothetical protein